jgi:hypothetical protein
VSRNARAGSSGCGERTASTPFVESFDAVLVFLEPVVAVVRCRRDLSVGEWPQRLALPDDGAEVLEAGTAQRRIEREEKVAPPVALARHRPVGLRVDREQHAGRRRRLRYALHEQERVAVRVGIDRPGAERVGRQSSASSARSIVRLGRPHLPHDKLDSSAKTFFSQDP